MIPLRGRMRIHREAWYREVVADERALAELKQRVELRDEDAVIPYIRLLSRQRGGSLGPLPELAWLQDKADLLRKEIVVPFEATVFRSSLLKTDYGDRGNYGHMYILIERAVRTLPDLIKGRNWAPIAAEVIQDLLEFSKRLPVLKKEFQQALDAATAERDRHPEAQEFAEDYPEEVEWVRETERRLDQLEIWVGKINRESINWFDEGEEDLEWEEREMRGLTPGEWALEQLSNLESQLESLHETLSYYWSELHTKGHPGEFGYRLSDDGSFSYQLDEAEGTFDEIVTWLRGGEGTRDLIEEILE